MKFLQHLDCTPYLTYECLRDDDHKITGIQITEVRLLALTDYLFTKIDPNNNLQDPMIKMNFEILEPEQQEFLTHQMLMTRYAIHRILTYFKLYSNDPWTFYLDRDYYGEDVEMVYLKLPLAQSIDKYLASLVNKKAHERLELVLKLEYGYLIPSVVNKEWQVTRVPQESLYFSNRKHYQQCQTDLEEPVPDQPVKPANVAEQEKEATDESKEEVEEENAPNSLATLRREQYRQVLANFTLPRAITIRNPNGQYKVIDGYHRLAGCPADQEPLIIYCEREELKSFHKN